jgi:predicted transcriptional regulator
MIQINPLGHALTFAHRKLVILKRAPCAVITVLQEIISERHIVRRGNRSPFEAGTISPRRDGAIPDQ